jgi:hypothetical protein
MGGSNSKSNLVLLTAKEHFVAHKLLVRVHPRSHGLWVALLSMSGRMADFTARIFASERERAAASRKDFKYTDKTRAKMVDAQQARRDEHSVLMKLWWADRKAAVKQEEIRL